MRRTESLDRIRAVLHRVAPKAKVILFGSEARGDAREDSDFDLLILEEGDKISYDRLLEITGPLYDLYIEENIEVSPIVLTNKQWNERPFKTPFYCNVMNEGIEL